MGTLRPALCKIGVWKVTPKHPLIGFQKDPFFENRHVLIASLMDRGQSKKKKKKKETLFFSFLWTPMCTTLVFETPLGLDAFADGESNKLHLLFWMLFIILCEFFILSARFRNMNTSLGGLIYKCIDLSYFLRRHSIISSLVHLDSILLHPLLHTSSDKRSVHTSIAKKSGKQNFFWG